MSDGMSRCMVCRRRKMRDGLRKVDDKNTCFREWSHDPKEGTECYRIGWERTTLDLVEANLRVQRARSALGGHVQPFAADGPKAPEGPQKEELKP